MPEGVDGMEANFGIVGEILLLDPFQLVMEDCTLADIDQPLPPQIVDLLKAVEKIFNVRRLIHGGSWMNLMLAHVFSKGVFVGIHFTFLLLDICIARPAKKTGGIVGESPEKCFTIH